MGKVIKFARRTTEQQDHLRKVISCACGCSFDVVFRPRVAGLLLREERVVPKGRQFNCGECGTTHDVRKEGKKADLSEFGTFLVRGKS